MSQLDEILNGPEYFYCEREHCRLRIEVCLKRQKANRERRPFMPISFFSCDGCDQGARNQLLKTSVAMNPKRGKGERNIACEQYSECLDTVAKKDWKSFNCESCGFYIETLQKPPAATVKQENTRICEQCSRNKTISAKHPLCPQCMAQRSNKKRPPNKKAPGCLKRKETAQGKGKHKAEIGQPRANFEVVFSGKYSQVLKEVEKLAEIEIRTVDEQIIYIIKTYLSNTQVSRSH